jgi:putative tricarboxylic transport membrane protein
MDMFNGIMQGLQVCMSLTNLWYCFVGVFIGTLIGVLPGIGPVGTIAILLPASFGMNPITATIMLAGVYYGAQYGGSRTSILLNIPGEATTIVTCFDGYPMAMQGRAGPALGMSAMASFIGGTLAIFALVFLVFPLAKAALAFGPPEYFGLITAGMTVLTFLGKGSLVKTFIMIFFGLVLSVPGNDQLTGGYRFTFGSETLLKGLGLIPLVMGFFGVTEVLENLEEGAAGARDLLQKKVTGLWPTKDDWKRCAGPIGRGSVIGFFLGILPGGGSVISSFIAYVFEKRVSKNKANFGKGAIEGVAAPEAAKDAAVGGGFIPLLALGIPPNAVMALLYAGLMIHGISAGPLLITQHPDLFWGVISSMFIGNIMLLALNLPLIGLWVKVLKVPFQFLMPLILLFCIIGVYATDYTATDILLMAIFGVVGYVLKKHNYDLAPCVLAYVLGPMLETNFRLSLVMGVGNWSIFFKRPISAVCLVVAALMLLSSCFSSYRTNKAKIDELPDA